MEEGSEILWSGKVTDGPHCSHPHSRPSSSHSGAHSAVTQRRREALLRRSAGVNTLVVLAQWPLSASLVSRFIVLDIASDGLLFSSPSTTVVPT